MLADPNDQVASPHRIGTDWTLTLISFRRVPLQTAIYAIGALTLARCAWVRNFQTEVRTTGNDG
jgi:hypothetical protein